MSEQLPAPDTYALEVGDLNDDGSDDLAIAQGPDDSLAIFFNPNSVTPSFLRGDLDSNGAFSGLLDGLFLLNFQFAGGATPTCMSAADVNGNGVVEGLIDALYALNAQFAGGPTIPAPFPDCGSSTSMVLSCDVSACP